MSPQQRVSGAAVYQHLENLYRIVMIPNANTGFRAGIGPGKKYCLQWGIIEAHENIKMFGFRQHTHWIMAEPIKSFPIRRRYRKKLLEIHDRLDGLTFGLLDQDQLAACIDNHMSGELHKLIRQLLTRQLGNSLYYFN